jgi:hypothetical protein
MAALHSLNAAQLDRIVLVGVLDNKRSGQGTSV